MEQDRGAPSRTGRAGRLAVAGVLLVMVVAAGLVVRPGTGSGRFEVTTEDEPLPPGRNYPAQRPVGQWEPVAWPDELGGRRDAVVVGGPGTVYVWGGRNGVEEPLADGSRYLRAANRWVPVAPGPFPWDERVMGWSAGGELLLVRSRYPVGQQGEVQVATYRPSTGWRSLPVPPPGDWLWSQARMWGRQLVVPAGDPRPPSAGEPLGTVEAPVVRLDLDTGTWVGMPPLPLRLWWGFGPPAAPGRLLFIGVDANGQSALVVWKGAWSEPIPIPVDGPWSPLLADDGETLYASGPISTPGQWATLRWRPRHGWARLPNPPFSHRRLPAVFAAAEGGVVWWAVGGMLLDPWIQRWKPLADPVEPGRELAQAAWAGEGLFLIRQSSAEPWATWLDL